MNSSSSVTATTSVHSFDVPSETFLSFSLVNKWFSTSYKTESLSSLQIQFRPFDNLLFNEDDLVEFLHYLALWVKVQNDDQMEGEAVGLIAPLKENITFPFISFQTVVTLYFQDKLQLQSPDGLNNLTVFVIAIKLGATLFNLNPACLTLKFVSVFQSEDLQKIPVKILSRFCAEFFHSEKISRSNFYHFTSLISKVGRHNKTQILSDHFKNVMLYLERIDDESVKIRESVSSFLKRISIFKRFPKMNSREIDNLYTYFMDEIRGISELNNVDDLTQVILLYSEVFEGNSKYSAYGIMSICFYYLKLEWLSDPKYIKFKFSAEIQSDLIKEFVQVTEDVLDHCWDLSSLANKVKATALFCNVPNFSQCFFLNLVTRQNAFSIEQKLELIKCFQSNFNPSESHIAILVEQLFLKKPPNFDLISSLTLRRGSFVRFGDKYDPLILALFDNQNLFLQKALSASILWWSKVVIENLGRLERYRVESKRINFPVEPYRFQLLQFLKLLYLKIPPIMKEELRSLIVASENIKFSGTSCLLWENDSFIIVTPESLPPI